MLSYTVSQRTQEMGIRIALGAQRGDVLWMVLRESLILVSIGFVVGLPAALAAGRLVSKMLFGLSPTDPFSISAAAILLLTFALLAGYLPARRAARVDPMVALRYE